MRWPFFRRKSKDMGDVTQGGSGLTAVGAAVLERPSTGTGPLPPTVELRDVLLGFVRDYLVASGAHVRVEEADVLSAVLPDGTTARYTTTLARARDEEQTELLVEGGSALTSLLERCGEQARMTSLRLSEACDAGELVRAVLREPLGGCEQCAGGEGTDVGPHCAACPLRAGAFAMRGVGRIKEVREIRRWEADSVELSYLLTSRDREGRRDEWLRLAFDAASGKPLAVLSTDTVAHAQSATHSNSAAKAATDAMSWSRTVVEPALTATAAFLRLRNEADYYARLDDIRYLHERLQRENPENASTIGASLTREIERLGEVFAIDTEAALQSVCAIMSPKALLQVRTRDGRMLELTVDMGRGVVEPITCTTCGTSARAGEVCERGHFRCAACASGGGSSRRCLVCERGEHSDVEPPRDTARAQTAVSADDGSLRIGHLDAMTAYTWTMFCAWLLEYEGFALERHEAVGEAAFWYGRDGDSPLVACAMRLTDSQLLGEAEVRSVADTRINTPGARTILMTTAAASAEAVSAAQRLNVVVIDRPALMDRLERHSRAREDTLDATLRKAQERAVAASAARTDALNALRILEQALAASVNTRQAAGGGDVAAATGSIVEIYQTAQQAFLVWDTLLTDWMTAFAERGARDGSLAISQDAAFFTELGQRARHLCDAMEPAFMRLGETPGAGELGYTAWRKAVLEECTARCEMLRWRFLYVDPARWQDFTQVWDARAQERADAGATAASHAAARAGKAYAQLKTHVRVPATGAER